jgi:hypothetical protein
VDLWLPVLLSAVFVFIASSVLHMLIPIHKGDHGLLTAGTFAWLRPEAI